MLANTHDWGQAMLECGGGFGGHQRVILVVIGAPLGVPDDNVTAPQLGQKGAADVTRIGTGVMW